MNNKKKLFLGIAGVGLLGLVGAGVGLLNNLNAVETKAAGESYKCNYGVGETWNSDYGDGVTEGGATVSYSFEAGKAFKFYYGSWAGELNYSNLKGSAAYLFTGDGTSDIWVQKTGIYDVTIQGTNLYIDLQDGTEFKYIGDADDIGGAWAENDAKSVSLNGSPVTISFTKNEQFKFRFGGTWDANKYVALGFDAMSSDYYGCFLDGAGNIKANYTFSYDVSLELVSHSIKVNIEAHNPGTETVYVLDLYGDLLNVSHRAHYYNGTIGTNYPGAEMDKPAGNDLYSITYWDVMTTVNFNQKGDGDKTGQTIDLTLTGNENKCLILNHDVNGEFKWNSNTWISLAAAQFIDQKMHFGDYNEDQYKTEPTANCASYYGAAKTAYNALASNAVRKEVLSIEVVKDRLSWWATANGDTLDVADGAALPVAGAGSISGTINNSSMNIGVIAAILATAVISVGSYFIIKKKHEN